MQYAKKQIEGFEDDFGGTNILNPLSDIFNQKLNNNKK